MIHWTFGIWSWYFYLRIHYNHFSWTWAILVNPLACIMEGAISLSPHGVQRKQKTGQKKKVITLTSYISYIGSDSPPPPPTVPPTDAKPQICH